MDYSQKKPRILVAEDEDAIRRSLMNVLTLMNYSTSCVDNGLDLMRLASSSSKFDLIISDVRMPKGQGNDMIGTLRENGIMTPAILLTGSDPDWVPKKTEVILKPHDQDHLVQTIERLLNPEQVE